MYGTAYFHQSCENYSTLLIYLNIARLYTLQLNMI